MARLPVAGALQAPRYRGGVTNIDTRSAGAGLTALGEVAGHIVEQEARLQDEADVNAFRSRLNDWESENVFNPETGAIAKQGKDSFGLVNEIPEKFEKFVESELAGSYSPRARQAIAGITQSRREQLTDWTNRHVGQQRELYFNQQFEANNQSSIRRAASLAADPALVAAELRLLRDRTAGFYRSRGAAEETIAANMAEEEAKFHGGVMSDILSRDDYTAGAAYMAKNASRMRAEDAVTFGRVLREGQVKAGGRVLGDTIAASSSTFSGALAQLNKIEDPEVREEAKRRVKEILSERETIKREAEESAMKAAYQAIEAGENPDNFSAARRLALADKMPTLRRAWDEKVGGTEPKTDYGVYLTRLEEANKNPQAFAKRNLFDDAASLKREDLERLLRAQDEIRTGKAGPELTFINTLDETVKSKYMDATGKKVLKKEDNSALSGFKDILQKAVQEEELMSGKKMNRTEIEAKADQLLLRGEVDPSGWFNSREFLSYEIGPQDIPDADRMEIIAELQRRGQPVTTSNIQAMYAKANARKD